MPLGQMPLGKKTPPHLPRLLGKLPPKRLRGLPRLSLFTAQLPPVPTAIDWSQGLIDWGSMGNDVLANCTAADCGHAIMTWTAYGPNKRFIPSTTDVNVFYSKTTGYVPGDASTDNGGYMSTVARWWLNNDLAGHKLDAICSISTAKFKDLQTSVYLFGGCSLGLELPLSAKTQRIWSVVTGERGKGGSWGGHAVWAVAYDTQFIYVVSWGGIIKMTIPFYLEYCSEAYGLYSRDWTANLGLAPNGFNATALVDNMTALTTG